MLEKKYMVVGDFCEYYNDDWQLVTHDIVECSDFKEALQEAYPYINFDDYLKESLITKVDVRSLQC